MLDELAKISCDLCCLDDVIEKCIQNDVIDDGGFFQVLHITLSEIIKRLDACAGI